MAFMIFCRNPIISFRSPTMKHWLFMFRPATYALVKSHNTIGVRHSARRHFANLEAGDRFVCYISQITSLDGFGEITSAPFEDDTPLFDSKQAYRHRCRVRFDVKDAAKEAGIALWSLEQFLTLHNTQPTNMIYCKGGFVEITAQDYDTLVAIVKGEKPTPRSTFT